MSQHPDILIVGGGVIGLTTAWYASGLGALVTVVDQGEIGKQASWAGAGILPPVQRQWHELPDGRARLAGLSNELWPMLSAELREASGTDNQYHVCGALEVAPFSDPAAPLPTAEWHTGDVRTERVGPERLREVEPLLSSAFTTAVHLPDLAQVRNPRHLQALAGACAARGVRLLPGWPIDGLVRDGSRLVGLDGPKGRLFAGRALLASGAWTDRLLKQIGLTLGVKPIRGQIVLFNTGHPGPRPVLTQGSRYLVPRLDGRVLAGSTEEDVGFDTRTTEEGITGLISFARHLVPSLAGAPIDTAWAGLRPGSPDHAPFLGPVPGCEDLYVAAGHFRSGLQLSPGTGWLMAQLMTGGEAPVSLSDLTPDRALPAPANPHSAPRPSSVQSSEK